MSSLRGVWHLVAGMAVGFVALAGGVALVGGHLLGGERWPGLVNPGVPGQIVAPPAPNRAPHDAIARRPGPVAPAAPSSPRAPGPARREAALLAPRPRPHVILPAPKRALAPRPAHHRRPHPRPLVPAAPLPVAPAVVVPAPAPVTAAPSPAPTPPATPVPAGPAPATVAQARSVALGVRAVTVSAPNAPGGAAPDPQVTIDLSVTPAGGTTSAMQLQMSLSQITAGAQAPMSGPVALTGTLDIAPSSAAGDPGAVAGVSGAQLRVSMQVAPAAADAGTSSVAAPSRPDALSNAIRVSVPLAALPAHDASQHGATTATNSGRPSGADVALPLAGAQPAVVATLPATAPQPDAAAGVVSVAAKLAPDPAPTTPVG